jgi:hypothetical protein
VSATHKSAIRARNEAMSRVEANADPEWKDEALAIIIKVAESQYVLTPDDIWEAGLSTPHSPSALGPVMVTAASKGLIRKTSFHENSRRGNAPPVSISISNLMGFCESCQNYGVIGEMDEEEVSIAFCDCGLGDDPRFYEVIKRSLTKDLGIAVL